MSYTSSLLLAGFIASDLPTKRWMRLIRPTMRLRVRVHDHAFVSSAITVDDCILDGTSIQWSWDDDGRSFFHDDEKFEIEIERRFLLRYECIRRTQRTGIYQIRTGDRCTLPLYDGQRSVEMLEDGIRIGDITFTLRSDVSSDGHFFKFNVLVNRSSRPPPFHGMGYSTNL